jgi:hypothetical protein
VAAVDAEDVFEVVVAEDQDPVEAFGADGTDRAFEDQRPQRRLERRPARFPPPLPSAPA